MTNLFESTEGKYNVVIKRMIPYRYGLRYEVKVYWNRVKDMGDIGWSYTYASEVKKLLDELKGRV